MEKEKVEIGMGVGASLVDHGNNLRLYAEWNKELLQAAEHELIFFYLKGSHWCWLENSL